MLFSDITPHTLTHQLHGDESLRETKSSREEDTREKEGGRKGGRGGSERIVTFTGSSQLLHRRQSDSRK